MTGRSGEPVESTDAGTVWWGVAFLLAGQIGVMWVSQSEAPAFAVPSVLTSAAVGILMTFRGVRFRVRERGKGFWAALGYTWLVLLGVGVVAAGVGWMLGVAGGG